MKKVLTIFGTRPEAIKLAPVILKYKKHRDKFLIKVCVTAQHREMLDQVLNLFKINPDYDLNIMKENQSLFDITSIGLQKLEKVIEEVKPHIIIVQGDTTTAFIASLAAYYLKVKIAHIEAGLRTEDKFNPFPEEMNRRLIDCLADIYFAPTEWARNNLIKEGFNKQRIFVTGNTAIDALLLIVKELKNKKLQYKLEEKFRKDFGIKFDNRKTILVTAHRRESFGKDLESICYGLKRIVDENHNVQIIFPVHFNPNIQRSVKKILSNNEKIYLINPVNYLSLVWLMTRSYLILTDSGGIQEEAPSIGKPILVMRKNTERPEGIEAGVAKLVGVESNSIFQSASELIEDKDLYQKMTKISNPYGDGKSSERIYNILDSFMEANIR